MITEDAGNLGFDLDRLAHIGDVINKDVQKKTYDGAVIAISRGGQTAALGAGSTMFWIDPDKDLTCVFLSSGLMEETYNIERFQRISDLVHASIAS